MIFAIQHTANWENVKIHLNNQTENSNFEQLPLNRGTENKYESPCIGPLDIMQVNDDGTVHLKVNTVEDTYSAKQIRPK